MNVILRKYCSSQIFLKKSSQTGWEGNLPVYSGSLREVLYEKVRY